MTLDVIFQFLVSAVFAGIFFFAVVSLAGLMTWGERKLASMIQDRIGPNRANIRLGKYNFTMIGLFHPIADAFKMFMKEDFIPEGAHKVLHTLAPMLSLFIPFVVFSAIPFAGPWHLTWKDVPVENIWLLNRLSARDLPLQELGLVGPLLGYRLELMDKVYSLSNYVSPAFNLNPFATFRGDALHLSDFTIKFVAADLDVGMLFVFAITSLAVYGMILAGWSSNNKYSFLGAIRGANQMISYEVGLGLAAVGLFMIYGGVSLNTLVEKQGELLLGVIPKWGIVTQPLAFLLFVTCGMAEIKRIPFDLPEGESEIIAGYFLEYSSLKFTMFLFGEYVEMILLAAVITTLFFGGWQIPWVSGQGIAVAGYSLAWSDTWLGGALGLNGVRLLVSLLQAGKFVFFLLGWVYLIFMIRWTFPRIRYDQLMRMGWKMVLPLAMLNIVVTAVVLAVVRGWL